MWPRFFSVVGEVLPIIIGTNKGKSEGLGPNVLAGDVSFVIWMGEWWLTLRASCRYMEDAFPDCARLRLRIGSSIRIGQLREALLLFLCRRLGCRAVLHSVCSGKVLLW